MMTMLPTEEQAKHSSIWKNLRVFGYSLIVLVPLGVWVSTGPQLMDRLFPVLTNVEIVMRDLKRTDALVFRYSFDKYMDCYNISTAWYGIAKDGRLERAMQIEPIAPLVPRPLGPNLSTRHVIVLNDPTVKTFKGVFEYTCKLAGFSTWWRRTWTVGPFTNWLAPTAPTQALAPAKSGEAN